MPDLPRRRAGRQQPAQQRLGVLALLGVDQRGKRGQAVSHRAVCPGDIHRVRLGARRPAHLGAAHRRQALDDRQRAQRALERARHRQAIRERGQGMIPAVFGPGRAIPHARAYHLGQRRPDRAQTHGVSGEAASIHLTHGVRVHTRGGAEKRDPLAAMTPQLALPVRDIRDRYRTHQVRHAMTVTPRAPHAHRSFVLGPGQGGARTGCYDVQRLTRADPTQLTFGVARTPKCRYFSPVRSW
jgi:hypothetical protein